MKDRVYHTLFLCTGNSARSILAEALLNHRGRGRFRAYSAGSHPAGQVHPCAVRLLEQLRIPLADARSKSWEEFAEPGAPALDFVFTVCDAAAGEACPLWPGRPVTAHWGVPDPAAVQGDDATRMRAFRTAFDQLDERIRLFTALPLESLEPRQLRQRLRSIGCASP